MNEIENTITTFLSDTIKVAEMVSKEKISAMTKGLMELKAAGGRLFILGVGGSAANASHAVNDFRKICGIESYSPLDNVSELTARINDESWEDVFKNWLNGSRLNSRDALLVFSVGGGTETTSQNLVRAMKTAKERGAKIYSIVSRNGGAALELSDVCVLIPVVDENRITPHAEGWQGVIWHMIVTALSEAQSKK